MKDFNLKSLITKKPKKRKKITLTCNKKIKKVKILFCAEFFADYFSKKKKKN